MSRAPRPSAAETFMEHAFVVAKRSTCPRALKYGGIGAVIVVDERIVSSGYCGSLRGARHCNEIIETPSGSPYEVGCLMDERTGGCVRTVHAETNAVLNAAFHGTRIEGGACYCTVSPCWDCFRMLVNGGVREIWYAQEYRLGVERQKEFAKELDIVFAHRPRA